MFCKVYYFRHLPGNPQKSYLEYIPAKSAGIGKKKKKRKKRSILSFS